jgi:glycosyltransferase involved in cell wall biosynthesis
MRILFVGGDLARKGGHTLVDAARRLRKNGVEVELDVVTREELPPEQGVTVHHGLGPNSPDLIDLYWRADVFCLPTLGDCLPMVLSEAGAAGLPLVSTDVGAIHEIVRPEQTGLLVPPNDPVALAAALERLAREPSWRRALGANALQLVRDDFNAATNASRLVDLLVDVARQDR